LQAALAAFATCLKWAPGTQSGTYLTINDVVRCGSPRRDLELKLRTKGKTIDEPAERFHAERKVFDDSFSEGDVIDITADINPIANIHNNSGRPPGSVIIYQSSESEVGDEVPTVPRVDKNHRVYSTGLVTSHGCFPLVGGRIAQLHVG